MQLTVGNCRKTLGFSTFHHPKHKEKKHTNQKTKQTKASEQTNVCWCPHTQNVFKKTCVVPRVHSSGASKHKGKHQRRWAQTLGVRLPSRAVSLGDFSRWGQPKTDTSSALKKIIFKIKTHRCHVKFWRKSRNPYYQKNTTKKRKLI